jgi:hypothetical protein
MKCSWLIAHVLIGSKNNNTINTNCSISASSLTLEGLLVHFDALAIPDLQQVLCVVLALEQRVVDLHQDGAEVHGGIQVAGAHHAVEVYSSY